MPLRSHRVRRRPDRNEVAEGRRSRRSASAPVTTCTRSSSAPSRSRAGRRSRAATPSTGTTSSTGYRAQVDWPGAAVWRDLAAGLSATRAWFTASAPRTSGGRASSKTIGKLMTGLRGPADAAARQRTCSIVWEQARRRAAFDRRYLDRDSALAGYRSRTRGGAAGRSRPTGCSCSTSPRAGARSAPFSTSGSRHAVSAPQPARRLLGGARRRAGLTRPAGRRRDREPPDREAPLRRSRPRPDSSRPVPPMPQ